jgi:hypothetical protein
MRDSIAEKTKETTKQNKTEQQRNVTGKQNKNKTEQQKQRNRTRQNNSKM